MGCWNGTCAVSNLHVRHRQDVAVFMLLKNNETRTFCYGNALYDICPIPFYGKYNDYGAVEDCHGFGLNMVVEAIRDRLYEFGQGPNSSHDIPVNKKNFDLEMLFEADHEDRLGIQHMSHWSQDSYDLRELQNKDSLSPSQQFEHDRLVAKIKQQDTFRQVTHVIIHGDIFRSIMNDWYIEDYVGQGNGNQGYENSYKHTYFKDLEASIPEYIAARKKEAEEIDAEEDGHSKYLLRRMARTAGSDWNNPNHATRWLTGMGRSSSMEFGLIDVSEYIEEYIEQKDWEGLASFVKEALTGAWVNSFMSHTRKIWTQQTGMGSQNQEPAGYKVLAESVLKVLKAEKDEYDEINAEDEDPDEEPLSVEGAPTATAIDG